MNLKNTSTLCALGVLGLMAQAAHADDSSTIKVGAGIDYTTGNYGTSTTTDITQVPVIFGYDIDRWSFKLDVPYIHVTGADNVIPGIGPVKNSNPKGRGHGKGNASGSTTPTTETAGSASGLGDITAAATYEAYRDTSAQFGIDVTGKIKFGTADADKGLGTGKNDYSFAVDSYKGFGKWTVFGGVSYTWLGSSQYLRLNDVFGANVGASYKLDTHSSFGAYYDYREKASDTSFARNELTGYYAYKFAAGWKAQAYVTKGFTDGSPDWGVGATVAYSF
ncbi:transporter [Dyella telluris]|uniref:Transporter n=1 Tax=Dyella telluris TaxID=2763498 RepID=A0A7G8Q1Y8_9GAMM|nr:transporter [Dyella telluris]QNK00796.1 transporter [Dyella telluris]